MIPRLSQYFFKISCDSGDILMFFISFLIFMGRKKAVFIHTVYKYLSKSKVFSLKVEYLSIK